jgi:chemotaxis signal transduction protein
MDPHQFDPGDFLAHLRDVQRCEASLRELNMTWRLIEASAKMNCPEESRTILPMLASTRAEFQRLERSLVHSLVQEKLSNVISEVGARARQVIDILVRNLFERTADVGFLATDGVLCEYLSGKGHERERIERRLRAYQEKYTVYEQILLIDLQGQVQAQLDGRVPLASSSDPLIARALESKGFVESFGQTDLVAGELPALVYAHRMLDPVTGAAVGVLCMVFSFGSEMQGIFRSRSHSQGRSLLLLLDAEDRVIASADEHWIPCGTPVPTHYDKSPRLCLHAGREYLVQTFPATPYQGYKGPPGWQGQVMVPVDVAFHGQMGGAISTLPPHTAQGLLDHARTFCPPLYEVLNAADTVRRVVWNGQVMTAGRGREALQLKVVLEQISEAGARTNDLFAGSIRDLYDTVLTSRLTGARSLTHLLVDLLDRNLYERANDCRWWARTPQLREVMAQRTPSSRSEDGLSRLLEGINALYTVYARLVVYDADGCIVAASRPTLENGESVLGMQVDPQDLVQVRMLKDPQAYHVSAFQPSALDDGRPTYTYHAAIRAMDDESRIVGGIGIVFNSQAELAAMLGSVLADSPETTALFVHENGQVLASTSPRVAVGSEVKLDFASGLQPGESRSTVEVYEGQYAIASVSVSAGYREFKNGDGHTDLIYALSYQPLGAVREQAQGVRGPTAVDMASAQQEGEEFATFFCGEGIYALPASSVREALSGAAVSAVSLGATSGRVGMLTCHREGQVDRHVWVYDFAAIIGAPRTAPIEGAQVIVVEPRGTVPFGLLVDELHAVPKFPLAQIGPSPQMNDASLITRLVRARQGQLMIQAIDEHRLSARLAP